MAPPPQPRATPLAVTDHRRLVPARSDRQSGITANRAPWADRIIEGLAAARSEPTGCQLFETCVTSASTSPAAVCTSAVTLTSSPWARAVAAVTGPMQATTGGTLWRPATSR
jgi:hypothetical protein